nr:aspartyl/asparaginyl beta-hydroxylase domain-containing protein [Sphingomonas sp. BT553]
MAAASAAQRRGDHAGAIAQYRSALVHDPRNPQVHNALGNALLVTGDAAGARRHFDDAVAADPTAPELFLNLAKACRLLSEDAAEQAALDAALRIDQRHFMARLRLAELHERRADGAAAATHWAAVVALAPSDAECPPGLVPVLAHARRFLAGRMAAFEAAVVPALAVTRAPSSDEAKRRFDACVEVALGKRRVFTNECHGLHYPFLPADEFFPRARFPWLAELEAQTSVIREEAKALLAMRTERIVPYVQQDPGTPRNKWSELDRSSRWSALFLWRHGVRDDQACLLCPATAALVDRLPLVDIPGRSPTVFFSILEPRTRIPPHTGVTNTRAIVHLPLIVPDGCHFRVGGETRAWREGEAFAFDDTIEHEAVNDSDTLRVVLIMDAWNPHLEPDERDLLRRFFVVSDESGFATSAPDD